MADRTAFAEAAFRIKRREQRVVLATIAIVLSAGTIPYALSLAGAPAGVVRAMLYLLPACGVAVLLLGARGNEQRARAQGLACPECGKLLLNSDLPYQALKTGDCPFCQKQLFAPMTGETDERFASAQRQWLGGLAGVMVLGLAGFLLVGRPVIRQAQRAKCQRWYQEATTRAESTLVDAKHPARKYAPACGRLVKATPVG
jgi:hypothetical protein